MNDLGPGGYILTAQMMRLIVVVLLCVLCLEVRGRR